MYSWTCDVNDPRLHSLHRTVLTSTYEDKPWGHVCDLHAQCRATLNMVLKAERSFQAKIRLEVLEAQRELAAASTHEEGAFEPARPLVSSESVLGALVEWGGLPLPLLHIIAGWASATPLLRLRVSPQFWLRMPIFYCGRRTEKLQPPDAFFFHTMCGLRFQQGYFSPGSNSSNGMGNGCIEWRAPDLKCARAFALFLQRRFENFVLHSRKYYFPVTICLSLVDFPPDSPIMSHLARCNAIIRGPRNILSEAELRDKGVESLKDMWTSLRRDLKLTQRSRPMNLFREDPETIDNVDPVAWASAHPSRVFLVCWRS